MSTQFRETLLKSFQAADLAISEKTVSDFELYYAELLAWNARVNLTAITAAGDAAIKHFLDSALVAKYVPLAGLLVDVGSGAGFPGIVLKIVQPELSVVLVEAVRKKASFQKQIIRLLKLDGITVCNGRMESFNRSEDFDFAVSRAFADLDLFCRLARPCLKPGGKLLAMKGSDMQELAAAREKTPAGFAPAALHTYELPQNKGGRSLMVLQKCFT